MIFADTARVSNFCIPLFNICGAASRPVPYFVGPLKRAPLLALRPLPCSTHVLTNSTVGSLLAPLARSGKDRIDGCPPWE